MKNVDTNLTRAQRNTVKKQLTKLDEYGRYQTRRRRITRQVRLSRYSHTLLKANAHKNKLTISRLVDKVVNLLLRRGDLVHLFTCRHCGFVNKERIFFGFDACSKKEVREYQNNRKKRPKI